MKKLTIITLTLFFCYLGNSNIMAQGADLFSFMEEYLTDNEAEQIDRAKSNISKGDKLESQIRAEDKKIQKYFDKKKKKGEKKSVEAKTFRIKQALYYEKAYSLIYTIYSEKVGNSIFLYEADESKANDLLEEASTDNASAKRKIKTYKSVTPKDLKKKVIYSNLKSDLQKSMDLYISSINNTIQAYSIFKDQETKKQLEEEENRVWQNALSDNSIYSYQNYLNEYPSGKYASEARSQISDLEEQERKNKEKMSRQGNLVYQVQIAASKKPLPKWKLSRLYKAREEITTKVYDNWHKYAVGNFKKYEDAKKFVNVVKVRGAFVVSYLNDEKIGIKEALGIEKNK